MTMGIKKKIAFIGGLTTFAGDVQGFKKLYRNILVNGGTHDLEAVHVCANAYCTPAAAYKQVELAPGLHEAKALKDQLNRHTFLTFEDMAKMSQADVYCIQSTFGSTAPYRVYDPATIFNKNIMLTIKNYINSMAAGFASAHGKKLIVLESGTLSRLRANFSKVSKNYLDHFPLYSRMGLNHWCYNKAKWCNPDLTPDSRPIKLDRFIATIAKEKSYYPITNVYNHKWRNNQDGYILIIGGLEGDPTHSYRSVREYISESYHAIRETSDRAVAFKPHPFSTEKNADICAEYDIAIMDNKRPLSTIQDECYCTIIDNSTSVFELINLGIPCVCSPSSFAAPLGNTNLSNVDNLYYASSEEVLKWYQDMAYTEFSDLELYRADMCKYVRELID